MPTYPVDRSFLRRAVSSAAHAEWREVRERKAKAVVRIFLLQTRSPEMIPEDADPRTVDFVDLILIRKGPGNNENQLMPVGGKVDDGEDKDQAVIRESMEETHLRLVPDSIRPFTTIQTYRFQHTSPEHGGNVTHKVRRAYFFAGQLLPQPHDVPYVLDPEEDKIKNFERLSLHQCAELFATGMVTTEHGQADVLDSLDLRPEARAKHAVQADLGGIRNVQQETLLRFRLVETEKKLAVLGVLLHLPLDPAIVETTEELAGLQSQSVDFTEEGGVLAEALITRVQTLWENRVHEHGFTIDQIKQALELVNVRYTLEHAAEHFDMDTGKGIPTVNLMFPLLFEGRLDIAKYRVMAENPQAKKLLEITRILHYYQRLHTTTDADVRAHDDKALRQQLQITGDQPIEFTDIQQWLYREKILNESFQQEYDELAEGIDKYFEVLQREAHITDRSIDQANEVKGAKPEKLVAMAFGNAPEVQTGAVDYRRLLRWEAQRKLILLLMLHEASAFRKLIQRQGIEPINQLEAKLETPDSKAGDRKLLLAGISQEVTIEHRTKTLMSLFRKLIVRDRVATAHDLVGDTYAETIIFNEPTADHTVHTFPAPCPMTDAKDTVLSEFRAPVVVAQYINELVKATDASSERVSILHYKGLPNPGEQFASSGPGGGAPVRMVKFYIQHIDKQGIERKREVQLFVPSVVGQVWQSGLVDYEQKKQDDQAYAVRRLFSTKALRSFMELLYPAEVYGDAIQPIYRARV